MTTKTNIKAAVRAALGCSQGDLFVSDDGTVFFAMGLRDSLAHKTLVRDFWYLVQNSTVAEAVEYVQGKLETWEALRREAEREEE